MDTEEKLSKLKAELDRVNQNKIRAELARETALAARNKALEELKVFDVESVEDAQLKLQELESELARALDEAETALKEIR